jgi:hypothetical protein
MCSHWLWKANGGDMWKALVVVESQQAKQQWRIQVAWVSLDDQDREGCWL